jgi:hypothetical protein
LKLRCDGSKRRRKEGGAYRAPTIRHTAMAAARSAIAVPTDL